MSSRHTCICHNSLDSKLLFSYIERITLAPTVLIKSISYFVMDLCSLTVSWWSLVHNQIVNKCPWSSLKVIPCQQKANSLCIRSILSHTRLISASERLIKIQDSLKTVPLKSVSLHWNSCLQGFLCTLLKGCVQPPSRACDSLSSSANASSSHVWPIWNHHIWAMIKQRSSA